MHLTRYIPLLLPLGLASPVVARPNARAHGGRSNGRAIYILSNEQQNSVVALPIAGNGMLSAGSNTATGGAGSNAIDGMAKQPAAPDALFSQSALTVAGNALFAVNAGSNTVTMFAIDKADPTKLNMIGKPVSVNGEFPNTVAASGKHKIVCVASTGAVAGISCGSFSSCGISTMDELRPIDLKQTTPPIGPTNTVSQVFFSNDQDTLYVTVKGDPTKNSTGFLGAFQVQGKGACMAKASVSREGVMSSPEGTVVLFGSSPIPKSTDLFVTDASFGAAVLANDPKTEAATVKGKGAIQDQKATCWSTISPVSNTAFVTDVAVNHLVEMSLTDASIVSTIDLTANGDPGLIDLSAAGKFVYALSPGNGTTSAAVTVVDVTSKAQVQHLQLKDAGLSRNAQGMALLL